MPDLGDYAFEILMSYGLALLLIFALVGLSLSQSRRAKAALEEVEENG